MLLLSLLIAGLPVDVSLLNGDQASGTLQSLSADALTVETATGEIAKLPTADLLEIRFAAEAPATSEENQPVRVRVQLLDGSELQIENLRTTSQELLGLHPTLGEVKLPLSAVRSLRFGPPEEKLTPAWKELLDKETRQDMVVVRKQDVLDYLDGVVGVIDDVTIKFLLDGDELDVKREKAYGIIYARKPGGPKPAAQAALANGDRLAVKALTGDGETMKLESAAGPTWSIPASALAKIDFSLGKIVYLSAMEPRSMKYTPFLKPADGALIYGEYRRDRNLDGRPLRLGQKTYARGLAIHSRTELVYRLGGDYRRFQAQMGIDDEFTNPKWGAVDVTIRGDGKELYSGVCRPRENPIPLDLDVSGVVELEILVDYGPDKDGIGDRLHLADARVVK
jgi:hypothetical protein